MSENRRYEYLIGVSFKSVAPGTLNASIVLPHPVTSMADVRDVRAKAVQGIADQNPSWDFDSPGWRNSVVILSCSLLRIEVERDGRWVLNDWQPWGHNVDPSA